MKRSLRFICFFSIFMVLTMGLLSCGKTSHTHTFSEKWFQDEENHWKECSECGETTGLEPHRVNDKWLHDDGYHWKECSGCGYKKDYDSHQFGDWEIITEPTEGKSGQRKRTCSCGFVEYEDIKPVQHTHEYGEWKVSFEPTVYDTGTLTRTCKKDQASDKFTLPRLNQTDYTYTVEQETTCEEGGLEKYVYTKDGQTFTFEHSTEQLGHNYEISWVWEETEATAVFTCQNDSSHVERIKADIDFNVITEASCSQSGSAYCIAYVYFENEQYIDEKTVEVSQLDHAYGSDWAYDGEKHYHMCSLCGDIKDDDEHQFENGKCSICLAEYFSTGLSFEKGVDTYFVSIGTCTATEIIIPSSYQGLPVTGISWQGFKDAKNVVSISLPNSLKYIDSSAFSGCSSLANLTIPSGVTRIEHGAFEGCSSLTSMVLPDNITSISGSLFKDCSSLTSMVLPDNITSISDDLFKGCSSLATIEFSEDVTSIGNGAFEGCTSLTSFVIPSGITTISANAFKGSGLVEITIPKNVETIYRSAFEDCVALQKVMVGSTTTWLDGCKLGTIQASAFRNCTALKEIYLPVSLKKIGSNAFYGCNLDKVYIKADNANAWIATTFENLDSNPVYHAKELYTWQPSIIGFGKPEEINLAFTSETGVIGAYAFAGLKGVKRIRVENANVKDYAFYETTAYLILVDIKSIGNYAFAKTNLQVFTSSTVESIGDHAFESCKDLEKITLPSKLTTIGQSVFNGCSNLKSASISYALIDKLPNHIESLEIRNTSRISSVPFTNLKTIEFSSEVKGFSNDAFKNCTKLVEVEFYGSVEDWCKIYFGNEYSNPMIYASVCKMYTKTSDGIVQYVEIKQLVVPDTITTIGSYAFCHFDHLEMVTLPATLTTISSDAFKGCGRLVEIYNYSPSINLTIGSTDHGRVAQHAKVIHTQEEASNLIKTEDGYVFVKDQDGAYFLIAYTGEETELALPATIEENSYNINRSAFENSNITSLIVPEGVEIIGEKAFANCHNLISVTLPSTITSIENEAFYQCYRLVEIFNYSAVVLEEGARENGAIARYAKVIHTQEEQSKLIQTDDGLVFLKKNKRYYLISYKGTQMSLTLPEKIDGCGYRINDYAFYGIDYLLSIVIPDSVKYIGNNVLSGCTSLESISIPFIGDSLTNKQAKHFGYLFGAANYQENAKCVPASLRKVTLTGETILENSAFYGCSYITTINIPDSITKISNRAFDGCTLEYNEYDNALYLGNEENPYLWLMKAKNPNLIETIDIHQDTKHIYYQAFSYCTSLTSVVIPEGVMSIEDEAFESCFELTNITLPNSLISLGNSVFTSCRKLMFNEYDNGYYLGNDKNPYVLFLGVKSNEISSLVIHPDTLHILNGVLSECQNLTSITIPFVGRNFATTDKGLFADIGLGYGGLGNDTLTEVVITGGNSIGERAFENCSHITNITLPESIETIGDYAFSGCLNLINITIPTKVTSIGEYAFNSCQNLTKVILPESLTSIGNSAFYECYSLTEISIPENVTSIGSYAFYQCGFESIELPKKITRIEPYTFYVCSYLKNITIPETVKTIDNSAFYGCISLTDIVIPNSVVEMGSGVFGGCTNLASVTLPFVGENVDGTGVTELDYIFRSALPSSLKKVIITGGTTIGKEAFSRCSNLTSIILPDTIEKIGYCAFEYCENLTDIVIPNSVHYIGSNIFMGCNNLQSISIPFVGDEIESKYNFNFFYFFNTTVPKALKNVTITGGNTIVKGAFSNCNNLTTISISEGITSIQESAFAGCTALTSVSLPNGMERIGKNAFSGCSNLESITIPESVTTIEDSAFANCDKLPYNEYNDGLYLGNVDNPYLLLVKAKTTDITSFEVNPNTKFIHSSAFSSCQALTKLTILNRVTSIGSDAFWLCNNLSEVYYQGPVEDWINFECDVFESASGCLYTKNGSNEWEKVTSIVIPEGVAEIRDNQFQAYKGVTSITIPSTITTIGSRAFYRCQDLASITIPDGVESIGYAAFYNCTSLTSVTLPSSVTSISSSAFEFANHLENVYYEGTIEDWCKIKFADSTSNPMSVAKHFYLRNSNNEWEEVVDIVIPEGTTEIGDYQFFGFGNVTSIIVPDSIELVGKEAFKNCNSLNYNRHSGAYYLGNNIHSCIILIKLESKVITSLEINSTTKAIYESVFENCTQLTSIMLPYGLKSIGQKAFYGCNQLTSVTIPDNVIKIGYSAFNKCTGLTTLTLPFIGESLNGTKNTNFGYIFGAGNSSYDTNYVPTGLKKVFVTGESKIGEGALSGCNFEYTLYQGALYLGSEENPYTILVEARAKDITSCEIHSDTKIIHSSAFYGCTNLQSLTIPSGITSIGGSAFGSCENLTDVYYEGSILDWCNISVGNNNSAVWNPMYNASHFYVRNSNHEWEELTNLVIPDGITTISKYQFYGLNSLTSLTIPNSVTSIDENAFKAGFYTNTILSATVPAIALDVIPSGNLTDLVITNGDTLARCYSSYDNLVNITIPKSITKIETGSIISECSKTLSNVYFEGTFDEWNHIEMMSNSCNPMSLAEHLFVKNANDEWEEVTSIVIPEGTTEVLDYQFYGLSSVTSITIPNSVTTIGKGAFASCDSLVSITIPNSVTSIKDEAFANNINLTSIVIPSSVEEIGKDIFKECEKLTEIYFMGTEEEFKNLNFVDDNGDLTVECYYYSDTEPDDNGHYWCYDEGIIMKW